jgi:hypothetical protein
MPDPIDELEGFTMSTVNPLPPGDVRRRGDRIRRRNNAIAAVGGLAVVAAIAAPFAVMAGHHGSSAPIPPAKVAWQTTVPASFDMTAVPDGSPVRFEARPDSVVDDFTLCGTPAFSTTSNDPATPATDTAGARYGEPGTSSSAGRTLAVYADDQRAQRALSGLRDAVRACPQDTGAGTPYLWGTVDAPATADDSVVISQQVRQSGYTGDLTLVEVVRVGNALFLGSTHTDAGGDQAIQETLPALTSLSQPILDQMCVFSATGCGNDQAEDPEIGEGAVPAIPADFPLDHGLPSSESFGERVPSPDLTSCGQTVPDPDAVQTARAQWRSVSEIRDRQLMTFSREADAQAYVESVAELYCGADDLGGGATRVTQSYGGAPLGDYAAIAVSHNELNGEVDPGLVLTQVVRVGRAVLLTQRIDEGFTWTGDVDQQSQQLVGDSKDELQTVVAAMCTFTDTGC